MDRRLGMLQVRDHQRGLLGPVAMAVAIATAARWNQHRASCNPRRPVLQSALRRAGTGRPLLQPARPSCEVGQPTMLEPVTRVLRRRAGVCCNQRWMMLRSEMAKAATVAWHYTPTTASWRGRRRCSNWRHRMLGRCRDTATSRDGRKGGVATVMLCWGNGDARRECCGRREGAGGYGSCSPFALLGRQTSGWE